MGRRIHWCDWRRVFHHPQRLLGFLVRDLWSGHAPQALVVVLGLLRPLTGREDHNRGVRGPHAHVGDWRYPGKRRAQLGLARLRGVARPGDLADARRVVVLGTRGQAALPPFCGAGLGRRRWLPCGAPLHLSLVARAARAASRVARAPCLSQVVALAPVACGQPLAVPSYVAYFAGGRTSLSSASRGHAARASRAACAGPPPFSSTPLIRIDRNYACLERYSKLKELERRLRRHRR